MFPGISPMPLGSLVEAGSITYGYTGLPTADDWTLYDFVCPVYNSLTVTVIGGSNGGNGITYTNNVNGATIEVDSPFYLSTSSRFNNDTIIAGNSGLGTKGIRIDDSGGSYRSAGTIGFDGMATGGDVNTTGGGNAGGVGGTDGTGILGGKGGSSGKAVKTYAPGDLIPGEKYTVKIGHKGAGATMFSSGTVPFDVFATEGNDGTDGSVTIVWT